MSLARTNEAPFTPIEHAAYHEAGHAVACVLSWRRVQLPASVPPLPSGPAVAYVEIHRAKTGHWAGFCKPTPLGPPLRPPIVTEEWRDALEWKIIFSLAGGMAEAILRGETGSYRDALMFAAGYCGMAGKDTDERGIASDIDQFVALRDDLWKLERGSLARPAQRTFTLLRKHWAAVEALSAELLRAERIDGADVELIFDRAMRHAAERVRESR